MGAVALPCQQPEWRLMKWLLTHGGQTGAEASSGVRHLWLMKWEQPSSGSLGWVKQSRMSYRSSKEAEEGEQFT